MSKDLEYFKDFLENPSSFNYQNFHKFLNEFSDYLTEHEGEFNYFEDKEWHEIRVRISDAVYLKDEINAQFEAINLKVEEASVNGSDVEQIIAYKAWLEFMKRHQFEYSVSDEAMKGVQKKMDKFINSVIASEVADRKVVEVEKKYQKAVENFDNLVFEHYERTGKRPILNVLPSKKSKKGN